MTPILFGLAALIHAGQEAPPAPSQSLFDKPIAEVTGKKTDTPLDRLSLDQLSRVAALPEARLAEMKCAGLTGWAGAKDSPALALDEPLHKGFVDKVVAAVTHDTQLDADIIAWMVTQYADEPDFRKQQGEWPAYEAEINRDCAPIIAQVKAGTFVPSVAAPEGAAQK